MSHSKQCLQVHCSRRRQWRQELDGEMVLRRPSTRGSSSSGHGYDRHPSGDQHLGAATTVTSSVKRIARWLFSLDRLVEEDVLILDLFS